MRMLKLLVVLILAGLIGLAGYAYFGDMAPTRQEVRTPLQLDTPAAEQPAEQPAERLLEVAEILVEGRLRQSQLGGDLRGRQHAGDLCGHDV